MGGRLGRQPLAGRANLEAGRPASATETAQPRSFVAGRWIVHPASTAAPKPRLELGRRDGSDSGWSSLEETDADQ